jgi:hypothetical protein
LRSSVAIPAELLTSWAVFLLLEILLLDLSHEIGTPEKVGPQMGGDLDWHDKELIMGAFTERNRTAGGYKMDPPLIN